MASPYSQELDFGCVFNCMFFAHTFWRTPILFIILKCESKGENNGRRNRDMFISLHNFKGKRACWNSKMGNTMSDKRVNYSHELAQTK
jgi:hypothetical protein